MNETKLRLALALAVLITAPAATAKNRATKPPTCPDGSSWSEPLKACLGTLTCPPGTRTVPDADGGLRCQAEQIFCPAESVWSDAGCIGPTICPIGTVPVDGGCVALIFCPPASHREDGGCVADEAACPAGSIRGDGGCLIPIVPPEPPPGSPSATAAAPTKPDAGVASCGAAIAQHDLQLAEPTLWSRGPAFQLQAGGTFGALIFPTSGGGILTGPGFQVEAAFSYGQFYIGPTFNFSDYSGSGIQLSSAVLGGEIGVQCNCGGFHVWRIGLYGGDDLTNSAAAFGITYRSTFNIYKGLFAGLDLRWGGLYGISTPGGGGNGGGNGSGNGGANSGNGSGSGGSNGSGSGNNSGSGTGSNSGSGSSGNSNGNSSSGGSGGGPPLSITVTGMVFVGYSFF